MIAQAQKKMQWNLPCIPRSNGRHVRKAGVKWLSFGNALPISGDEAPSQSRCVLLAEKTLSGGGGSSS